MRFLQSLWLRNRIYFNFCRGMQDRVYNATFCHQLSQYRVSEKNNKLPKSPDHIQ